MGVFVLLGNTYIWMTEEQQLYFKILHQGIGLYNMEHFYSRRIRYDKFHLTYHQQMPEIILSNQQINVFTLFMDQTFRGVHLLCRSTRLLVMKIPRSPQIVIFVVI